MGNKEETLIIEHILNLYNIYDNILALFYIKAST